MVYLHNLDMNNKTSLRDRSIERVPRSIPAEPKDDDNTTAEFDLRLFRLPVQHGSLHAAELA